MKRWIKADRAITGDGRTVLSPAWVGVEGEVIFEVTDRQPDGAPPDNVQEFSGVTLIPGLLNIHDHICRKSLREADPAGRPFGQRADTFMRQDSNLLTLYGADNMKKYLYDEGITWVRDLGLGAASTVAVRTAIKNGLLEGPEVTTSVNPITMTGGHCYRFSEIADGEAGVITAVRRMIQQGADIIKFMGSGGLEHFPEEDPKYPQFTVKELAAGVETAHDQGKDVAIHVYSAEGIRRAIEAGVDNIEHGSMMNETCLEVMAEKGLFWNPTMTGIRGAVKSGPNIKYWDLLQKRVFGIQEQGLRKAKKLGILIGAGTDTMGYLADEIEMLRATLDETPVQALAHATSINAIISRRTDLGLLEKGRKATLVAVKGDLTKSLASLKGGIVCTWKDGIAYQRREGRTL